MTLSLTQIANEEGTDKGTIGPTEEWYAHNYTDIYEAYLHPFRDQPITLLEVGLGVDGPNWKAYIAQGRNATGGASMRMWYRYMNKARIFGADINPATFLDNDRITTAVVDQGDADQLRAFVAGSGVERFDVIIDDGSHRPDHQQITLSVLFPHLAPGGLYFIEDLTANGIGDPASGRSAAPQFVNTRRLLREYDSTGAFPSPHTLLDPDGLASTIESISFHCPRVHVKGDFSPVARLMGRQHIKTRFLSDQAELCVLRKVASR